MTPVARGQRLAVAIAGLVTAGCTSATTPVAARAEVAASSTTEPIVIRSEDLRWSPVPGFDDGRARAVLLGDPVAGGPWLTRTRVPNPIRVPVHTHPVDEQVTVLEGTWYLGFGRTFVEAELVAYPSGSLVVIPAGMPHFVATHEGMVTLQSAGTGAFRTDLIK